MSRAARRTPPLVVFETGVLLRALLLNDAAAQALRQAWQQGRCRALVCPASARALMLALACPALGLTAGEQHELLADYLPYATVPATLPAGLASTAGLDRQALTLARSAGAALLVADSPGLRSLFARRPSTGAAKGSKTLLLGSAEFLAQL